jgi:hypothetical protein
VKRSALAVFAIAAFALGAGSAVAAPPDVETFPVTFVISSATCSNLPAGTTIRGTGMEKSITTIRTDKNGVTTIMNTSHANGTATDQAGNTYVFNYANHFSVSDSGPGTAFSGEMVDAFSLAGNGPAHLSNGFRAQFDLVTLQPLSSRGDPIDFASGMPRCDPL